MIDLSNNNATGHNFHKAYVSGGQRRLYLKRVGDEGRTHHFVDTSYPGLRDIALGAGFRVGAYTFCEPLAVTPRESAELLLSHITLPLRRERDLRPCIDLEFGRPTTEMGAWAAEVAGIIHRATGFAPVVYGSGFYLEALSFHAAPGPLWLAAFGRNDGREYPIARIPRPWKRVAAHQYTSNAHVLGIHGDCDLSHVFVPRFIDVPRSRRLATVGLGHAGQIDRT